MNAEDLRFDDLLPEDEGTDVDPRLEERSGAGGAAEFLQPDVRPAEGPPSDEHDAEVLTSAVVELPRRRRRRGPRLARPDEAKVATLKPADRLLILDTWKRSGLPASDFGALVGLSKFTLYEWKQRFEAHGPGGLVDGARGPAKGSKVDEVTRRAILMIREAHPDYGCERISLMLLRGPGLGASASTVARVLKEEGHVLVEQPTRPHGVEPKRFEHAKANGLWQTDLFTFVLKRQNRRVYMVAFLDDHSRFVVGFGIYASQSTALVLEVLRASVDTWGAPTEILTDNGSQYVTWRGKSAFRRELDKRGIQHVVAHPKRPQTLGKVERFWKSLWDECVEDALFQDLEDARKRIGLYIDHYNFQRPHQGLDGAVPADRFFGAAPEVLKTLKERVVANALELARRGAPKKPFYLTGQVGDQSFSLFAEGERVYLRKDGGEREELDLAAADGARGLPANVVDQARALIAAPPAKDPLPEAVVPEGRVATTGPDEAGNEQPGAPGTSVLDAVVFRDADDDVDEEGGDA